MLLSYTGCYVICANDANSKTYQKRAQPVLCKTTFIVLIQQHIGACIDYYAHHDAFLQFTLRKSNINTKILSER